MNTPQDLEFAVLTIKYDETTAVNDMNNHFLPYFESSGFPASSVELISIGLNQDPVSENDSFIGVDDLGSWHNANGYNWTFVWDEGNLLFEQYNGFFEGGEGWAGGIEPRYLIMDRNHFVRLVEQGSLDGIAGTGGSLVISPTTGQDLSIDTDFTGITTVINNRTYYLGQTFDSGIANPEVKAHSGSIIYVDNRPSITRSSNQKEDIKVILQF